MSDEAAKEMDALGYMRLAISDIADAARLQGLISEENWRQIKIAIWSQDAVAVAIPALTPSVASVASGVEAQ